MKTSAPRNETGRSRQRKQKEAVRSWFAALKQAAQGALQIDRSKVTAGKALHSSIAYVLPLALGVGTGHILEGVLLAAGAALLGAVELTSPQHARIRTLLLACLGIALSAFIGTITGNISWLNILLVGLWGVGTGLLIAVSQSAMIVGLQSTLALLIFSHYASDPGHAALASILLFCGALFQTLVAMIPFPLESTAAERSALVSVYQWLAAYAAHPCDEKVAGRLRDALKQAQATIAGTSSQTQSGQIFFGLLEEAERMRSTILLLVKLRPILAKKAMADHSLQCLDQLLQTVSDELQEIPRLLQPTLGSYARFPDHGRADLVSRSEQGEEERPDRAAQARQALEDSLTTLRLETQGSDHNEVDRYIMTYCRALYDQLARARELAQAWRDRRQELPVQVHVPPQKDPRFRDALTTLRANLTLRSTAFRHAVRLGAALVIASLLEHLVPLPLQRGYWIPLTILFILRPDFTATFSRSVARFLGTIGGVVLADVLILLIRPSPPLLALFAIVTAYLSFSLFSASYALFSVFITMEVIFLLTFIIPQPFTLADSRVLATAIGGSVALLVYLLWPTWERSQVAEQLARRLDALRAYADAVFTSLVDPHAIDAVTLYRRRKESRLARSNAEASLQRLLQEPQKQQVDTELVEEVLGAADRIAQSVLTLEAYLVNNPGRRPLPAVRPFAAALSETLDAFATALRRNQPPGALPNMREALATLEYALQAEPSITPGAHIDRQLIIAQVRRIVDATDFLNHLLTTRWVLVRFDSS